MTDLTVASTILPAQLKLQNIDDFAAKPALTSRANETHDLRNPANLSGGAQCPNSACALCTKSRG
jgi:hypothetical protein